MPAACNVTTKHKKLIKQSVWGLSSLAEPQGTAQISRPSGFFPQQTKESARSVQDRLVCQRQRGGLTETPARTCTNQRTISRQGKSVPRHEIDFLNSYHLGEGREGSLFEGMSRLARLVFNRPAELSTEAKPDLCRQSLDPATQNEREKYLAPISVRYQSQFWS